MNWDRVMEQQKQVGTKLKEKWSRLTDDDLVLLGGRKELFVERLQERYQMTAADAERQLDLVLATMPPIELSYPPGAEDDTDPSIARRRVTK